LEEGVLMAGKLDDHPGIALVIFDADGTLCTSSSGKEFRRGAGDWKLLPRRLEACQSLQAAGILMAVASNQGGVAFGHLDAGETACEIARLGATIGAVATRMCPFHPEGTVPLFKRHSVYRKPSPGMLTSIMEEVGVGPDRTLFVGDRPEDEEAALAAGCCFAWAQDFFQDR
jgi:D-glycero-D-manno-heptose 1,7-bisphosphate phosphatase